MKHYTLIKSKRKEGQQIVALPNAGVDAGRVTGFVRYSWQ